jgi:serine protease Do
MEVMSVNDASPAAKAGIKKGDILVGLHQWETVNLENIAYVLGHPDLPAFGPLNFYVLRAGQIRRGTLGPVN